MLSVSASESRPSKESRPIMHPPPPSGENELHGRESSTAHPHHTTEYDLPDKIYTKERTQKTSSSP
ncbi:hypothetical protein LZ32DRAFT_604342 [Colletotrichum eremochloae]|nr:hypothetical protein LZ32DRAFT_604342 [Colletotrichum eremochloae]